MLFVSSAVLILLFILSAFEAADVLRRSKVFLVTDLRSSTLDVEKLHTSFTDGADKANVPNDFVILQRGRNGNFKSHGSFKTLSKVQDR